MSALTIRELSEKTIRTVKARTTAVLALAGQWKDKRSDEEILQDVEGSRTFGREVEL